jgi:hypothetical protein
MRHNSPLLLMLLPVLCLFASATEIRQRNPSPQASTGGSQNQETIREILDLERQSKDAAVQRDPTFAQRTLADDYLGITPLGQVITKADTVTARKSGQLRYDSIDVSDVVVRVYGNTAVVTARATVRGIDLGEEFNGSYRFTRVWIRRNGHWQAASYQATVTR